MSSPKSPKRKYDVGYGKPPKHTQFKSGQSGNPRGRPKGTHNFNTDLEAELREGLTVTEAGRTKVISKQQAIIKSTTAKALKGDTKAAAILFGLIARLIEQANGARSDDPLDDTDHMILDLYRSRPGGKTDPEGGHET